MRRFSLLAPLALLIGCGATYETAGQYTLSESQVASIEAQVRHTLIDEESARFRNIRAVQLDNVSGEPEALFCGEVNSRNRMGGYAGYQIFHGVVSEDKPQLMSNEMNLNGLLACRDVLGYR